MGLTKCILGHYLELCSNKNTDLVYGIDDVRGVNNLKQLMTTKADLNGRDLSKFQIVNPGEFVFNHRTSRNGSKFSIAYNDGDKPIICTEDYVVFKIRDDCKKILNARWLYMFFNRPEFDRFVITNSWGSSTEFYNWEDIQAIGLELPPLLIQRKYANVYNAMFENQKSYEYGLENLKLACDAYIEDLRRQMPCEAIATYIEEVNKKNVGNLKLDSVRGIATSKEFINTKANMEGVSLENYKVVEPGMIAFISDTSRRADKMSLALNQSCENYLVSSISTVIQTDNTKLLPKYLYLFFCRTEFDRYARFHSWGSARETFSLDDMKEVRMPLPSIDVQKAIVGIYEAYKIRKEINEKLKAQIKDICPILIKGSIEEARKAKEA